MEGMSVGITLGRIEGASVDNMLGRIEGRIDGNSEGSSVGTWVVGCSVGDAVGGGVETSSFPSRRCPGNVGRTLRRGDEGRRKGGG